MKYYTLVLLGVFLASCRSAYEGIFPTDLNIAKEVLTTSYMSPNGSKNIYVVDSIPFNPEKHIVICKKQRKPMAYEKDEHRKLGILRFIVTNDFYNYNTDFSTKSIMSDGNNALYIDRLSYDFSRDLHFYFDDEDCLKAEYKIDSKSVVKEKDSITVVSFTTNPPSFFRVYLVKGAYLNHRYNHTWDGYNYYWDFPTQEAYYKVFVPVWLSSSEVKPLVKNTKEENLEEGVKRVFYKERKKIIKKWGY